SITFKINIMITPDDKKQLAEKGISEAQITEQLSCFQKGFPYLKLEATASTQKGILALTADEQQRYLSAWYDYTQTGKRIMKFVPASGAASRMFKDLFEFLEVDYDVPATKFEQTFFTSINNFAFYEDLNEACVSIEGKDIASLIAEGKYKAIVSALLDVSGLNYGFLPKGLLKFHKYENRTRTSVEEHLVEGALYATGKTKEVNIHFTVSAEHYELFKTLIAEKTADYTKRYGVDYDISFSKQKSSTDTIAAGADNTPFRDNDRLVFR
ncbi:hypothetical protein EZS27_040304, partial [termite gut metagenome]